MSDVVFALRRNASTHPPEQDSPVADEWLLTDQMDDQGLLWFDWRKRRRRWYRKEMDYDVEVTEPANPQPSWWLDVRPSDEPLTTEHLEELCDPTFGATGKVYTEAARARLRAALDALTTEKGDP